MSSKIWFFLFWITLILLIITNFQIFPDTESSEIIHKEIKEESQPCLSAIFYPKSLTVEKGEYFECSFRVGEFIPYDKGDKSIFINGDRYDISKEGIVKYRKKTYTSGKRTLEILSSPRPPIGALTGEKICGSQRFEYLVTSVSEK